MSVSPQGNNLATNREPASTPLLSPAAAPNGGTATDTWWAHIKDLSRYDPNYVYGLDGTDDAYGQDGVHFTAGGTHGFSIDSSVNEARRLLGMDRVSKDRCLKLPDLRVSKTHRYAQSGQVKPDVFIQEHPCPGDNRHEVVYGPNNPILLVLEMLSQSTFRYDIGSKVEIY